MAILSTMARRSLVSIIFLTVFLDMLGISIIIPVIPALFFDASTSFFSAEVDSETRSVLYGFLVAAFPLMQFFGAPILGTLSDRYGRRPILLISLLGTMVGYLLFAMAILIQDIYLLFFSRMLPGFMGGNVAIIMSAMSDVSTPEERAKNFGLVGAAFGLGFILGPTIGGILADDSIISWFDHATPFWFTALLTLVNIILVVTSFKETLTTFNQGHVSLLSGVKNIATAFKDKNLSRVFTIVLLLAIGFTFFTQFFSVLLIEKFSYSEKDIGFLYGWVGIWLVITQGFIVRRMSSRVKPTSVLLYSIPALAISIALILVPAKSIWFYLINPLIALSQGMTAPFLTTIVSQQVDESKQGQILGINQSMNSLGHLLPPVVAGYLNTLNGNLPLAAGAFFIFLGWIGFLRFKARSQ